jgi:hypothetical protein
MAVRVELFRGGGFSWSKLYKAAQMCRIERVLLRQQRNTLASVEEPGW